MDWLIKFAISTPSRNKRGCIRITDVPTLRNDVPPEPEVELRSPASVGIRARNRTSKVLSLKNLAVATPNTADVSPFHLTRSTVVDRERNAHTV